MDATFVERKRCVALIEKYREQAKALKNDNERQVLLLALGLLRAEIVHA